VPTVLAAGLAAVCLGTLGGSASADATYDAIASATGAKFIFSNQSVPLGIEPQLEGPVAQARQTSLQQSDAYAAFPYPGDAVAGLPGVLGSAAGIPFQAPPYPFSVNTTYGDDIRQLSYPGIELRSESGETVTQAAATGGSGGLGASSTARIARDGDAVAAKSRSDADLIRLGNSLVISGLHASADAARDGNGTLTRASHLSFTRLQVPGLAFKLPSLEGIGGPAASQNVTAPDVGFTDGQFVVTLPGAEPKTAPVPTNDVLAALKAAGYTATYQAAKETKNGILGAGFEISTTLPAPPPGTPAGIGGETPVTMSIGFARAEVAYAVEQSATGGAAAPTGTAPAAAGASAVTPDLGVAAAPTTPLLPTGSTFAPGLDPQLETPALTSGGSPAVALPEAALGAAPATGATTGLDLTSLTASRAAIGSDVGWIYLMLVAVAGTAFAATFVMRYRGVRSR
jgi:hypothetical protein